jgi:hypothetical protein
MKMAGAGSGACFRSVPFLPDEGLGGVRRSPFWEISWLE